MTAMPPRFDAAALGMLDRVAEVQVETTSLDGVRTHRTIVWIVTAGDQAFIPSVRGDSARWYREARRRPEVLFHVEGASVPVLLVMADDPTTIEQVSEALRAKYRRLSPSTASMLRAHTLPMTMHVEPR